MTSHGLPELRHHVLKYRQSVASWFATKRAPAVWCSDNGGDQWKRLALGLPRKESYFTVLHNTINIPAQLSRGLL